MPGARWLVALAFAGLLGVGCTQQEGAAVIGVPAPPNPTQPSPPPVDPAAITAGLYRESATYASMPAMPMGPLAPGEAPIDSLLTARQQERLAAYQAQGWNEINVRLAALASLRATVTASGLAYFQQVSITALIDNAAAQLPHLGAQISNEQSVDRARRDVAGIRALNIDSVVLPEARKMLKAYYLLNLASIYESAVPNLQAQVINAQSLGCNVSAAQAYVSGLAAQSRAMRSDGNVILADVQSQSRGGMRAALSWEAAGSTASANGAFDKSSAQAAIAALHAQGC